MSMAGSQSARGSNVDNLRRSTSSFNHSASRKPRSQVRGDDTRASMMSYSMDSDTGLPKSSTLKASEKLLGEKLEKEIKRAILDVMKV